MCRRVLLLITGLVFTVTIMTQPNLTADTEGKPSAPEKDDEPALNTATFGLG